MLWVNLIMDSFASLALATEDPTGDLLKRKPYPRDQAVLSQVMVRNMLLHSGWQLIVLSFIIFGMGDVCRCGLATPLLAPHAHTHTHTQQTCTCTPVCVYSVGVLLCTSERCVCGATRVVNGVRAVCEQGQRTDVRG